MIGTGLRKLASEKGLKVSNGVAYGFLHGYGATFSEGSGFKTMVLSTRFPEAAARRAFTEHLQSLDLDKEFKLKALNVQEKVIHVVFTDTVGTMKRIEAFIQQFIPILEQYGASKSDVCPECGMMLSGGTWKLVNGIAIYVHEACGERIRATIQTGNEERLGTGSYLPGAVGAFLGALGGAVVWAIGMVIGFVTSVFGLLIGFLAEKCYTLFHGKNGKGKIAILLVAIVFGVLAGSFAAEVISVVRDLEFTVGDSVDLVITLLQAEPEVRSVFIKNVLIGLLFAGLGVAGLLAQTKREVTGTKYIDLK